MVRYLKLKSVLGLDDSASSAEKMGKKKMKKKKEEEILNEVREFKIQWMMGLLFLYCILIPVHGCMFPYMKNLLASGLRV